MWNPLNLLKTSEKAVDTGLGLAEKLASGIDVMVFTEEEKAKARAEAVGLWIKVQESLANENSARSITRRIIAKHLTYSFIILLFWAGAVFPFNPGYAGYLRQLAEILAPWVGSVVAFYFVYYGVQQIVKSNK